jgi:hypothetical protein
VGDELGIPLQRFVSEVAVLSRDVEHPLMKLGSAIEF